METPVTGQTKRQKSHEFSKKLIKLTVAGGVAFWVVDLAMSLSPISAEYMAAFSISSLPLALVEALVGGMIIACFVSYFLLRFFDKIPTKNPTLKSLILSFAALAILEVLSTFGNPSNAYVYLLVDTVMNIPRILALGIVIGYLYKKLYEQA
jgi:CBS-domain-containing membrane protein